MNVIYLKEDLKYTGAELIPHWIYKKTGEVGDSICAFSGEAEVKLSEMVDIEDVLDNEPIYSKKMLNFIIEHFDTKLSEMVLRQRIFITIIKEILEDRGFKIKRDGDDLFFENKKLTVSIATKSITSCLIHTGINIVSEGAAIEVSSLNDMKIDDVEKFALEVMEKYKKEILSVKKAQCKVRGVI